jgi:hypothetical protein
LTESPGLASYVVPAQLHGTHAMIICLLFAAALAGEPTAEAKAAAPAPVAAVSPAQAPGPVSTKTAKADPERICRLEAVLGSKITKKVCYNRALMEQRTFDDKQNLDLLQSQTLMKSHE